jgi:hypothetical protein
MNALLGWLKEDADAAMAYLATSSKRDEIYASLFAIWSQQEPEAASGWAAQHRGQPGSDAVAAGVAKGTAKQDPASAATWVAAIKDPLIKLDAAQSAGATMFAIDETMALTELQRWNIPASGAEPMVEAWRKAFTSKAARNAQNLASTFTAARSAGANITADSIEGVLAVLQNGIKGSGAFKTTMFQLSADFSPRELAALSTQLKVDQVNNLLQFTGATAAPQ